MGLTPSASYGSDVRGVADLGLSRLSTLDFWTGLLDFQTGLLDFWTGLLGFSGFLGSLWRPFWGTNRNFWTPDCEDFVAWTSRLDFWTSRLHFGLLDWTFWLFLLLAEHAGTLVFARDSACPDFGMDPSLVVS